MPEESSPNSGGDRSTPAQRSRIVTRRWFMAKAVGWLGTLGLAGLVGYEWPRTAKRLTEVAPDYRAISEMRSFVSRPDLRPPVVRITTRRSSASPTSKYHQPRFIFITPRSVAKTPSQPGLMILNRHGRLIWFNPILTETPFDFNVQNYQGQPHLTWFQGEVTKGVGAGIGAIANNAYQTIETIHAGNGLEADLHELLITTAGTALITAYEETTADLSILGGPRQGKVLASHAQEIDLASGKVLFDWNSLDHVGVDESYATAPSDKNLPFDYFHINSICETPDGNLLISARHTWALYKVDRSSGQIIWRMNGKRSDFSMSPGASFHWQHDARMPEPTMLTVFDDGSNGSLLGAEKRSRALVLSVNTEAMDVKLEHAYVHPAGFIAASQGSVRLLPDGRVFVGWGSQPYFSEFAPDGTLLLDGQLPRSMSSYRAFTHDWVGHPTEPPSIAVRANSAGGAMIYASWNGATEIESWTVLAGKDESSLRTVGSQKWSNFETDIAVNSMGPHFRVAAMDNNGKELGRSEIVKLDVTTIS